MAADRPNSLEEENERLRGRLRELTEEVSRNDALFRKTQERELELLRAGSLAQLLERLIDGIGGDAHERRPVSIDLDRHLIGVDLQVAGHVLEPRQFRDRGDELRHEPEEFVRIGILQRVLVLGLGQVSADADDRDVLQENREARYPGQFRAQFLDDFLR